MDYAEEMIFPTNTRECLDVFKDDRSKLGSKKKQCNFVEYSHN